MYERHLFVYHGSDGAESMIAVIFDPKTNKVIMTVVPDSDAALADPAFNPPGFAQLRLDGSIYSATDMTTLAAVLDAVNPSGKELRQITEADAAKVADDAAAAQKIKDIAAGVTPGYK